MSAVTVVAKVRRVKVTTSPHAPDAFHCRFLAHQRRLQGKTITLLTYSASETRCSQSLLTYRDPPNQVCPSLWRPVPQPRQAPGNRWREKHFYTNNNKRTDFSRAFQHGVRISEGRGRILRCLKAQFHRVQSSLIRPVNLKLLGCTRRGVGCRDCPDRPCPREPLRLAPAPRQERPERPPRP